MNMFPNENIEFNGFVFNKAIINESNMCLLYLISKARKGDEDAVSILNEFEITVVDEHGNYFWPMKYKEE